MEVMLALVTEDFHDSVWTNQEVGYALGKGVPVIPIKFEQTDPQGFIGPKQALKGYRLDHVEDAAPAVYSVLVEKLGQKGRLQQALVSAFASSSSYEATRKRFDRLENAVTTLSDDEITQIQIAFAGNEFLHGAWYLNNQYDRLTNFMKRCTGKQFEITDGELRIKKKGDRQTSGRRNPLLAPTVRDPRAMTVTHPLLFRTPFEAETSASAKSRLRKIGTKNEMLASDCSVN